MLKIINIKKLLKEIVNLHFNWAKESNSRTDIQCFTIREIESLIKCLKNEAPYNVIMTIYGGRFKEKRKDELKLKLKSSQYEILKSLKEDEMGLTEKFPECFINPLASPSEGAPALKYGDINTETISHGEVKGLIMLLFKL